MQLQELAVAFLIFCDFLKLGRREAAELVLAGFGLVVLEGGLVGSGDVHLEGGGRVGLAIKSCLVLLAIQNVLSRDREAALSGCHVEWVDVRLLGQRG